MTDVVFSEQQEEALKALFSDASVLLSGVSGCGKSTLLRRWMERDPRAEHAIVMAPTGVAALQVGGSTIHRIFGLRPDTDLNRPRCSDRARKLLSCAETLVVDEISMVRADLFHAMDEIMRQAKGNNVPFGGARLILVGDFWQLPPVVRSEEQVWMRSQYGSDYGWCFLSPAFRKLDPRIVFLAQPFRQRGDADFAGTLDRVRRAESGVAGSVNRVAKSVQDAAESVPWLCARKDAAERRNEQGLRRLGGNIREFLPDITGDKSKVPKESLAPLRLARNARVMVTRNGEGYVNGSLGTVTGRSDHGDIINVKLDAGHTAYIKTVRTDVVGFSVKNGQPSREVLATVSQFPLMLGYAWTIHKSQGQTLQAAVVDLGRGAFAHGQTYVALSRLESMQGLHLVSPLQESDMLVDPVVPTFFEGKLG